MKASAQRGPSFIHQVPWDSNQRGVSLGDRSESRAVADNGAMSIPPVTDPVDLAHLRRCVELAREGLDAGDEPFGSLLVDASGVVRFEDRNRVAGGDHTRHPEFEIARWAAANLSVEERRASTVYTSGEHCPMCSAAHAWVGLGRIVYATSS